jgi:hypothetical protein
MLKIFQQKLNGVHKWNTTGRKSLDIFVAYGSSDVSAAVVTRSARVDIATTMRFSSLKRFEYAYGEMLWKLIQKAFWTMITDFFLEWNVAHKTIFLNIDRGCLLSGLRHLGSSSSVEETVL